MKHFKLPIAIVAMLAMFITSCSKEDSTSSASADQETFQIQFGTLLNNIESKAHESDPTECREDLPSYVLVGITDDNTGFYVGGPGNTDVNLVRVNIQNNNGSWETSYSDVLGLPAGDYTLQYFIVYSSDDEVLWVAPRVGGDYASSVGDPLPQEFTLEAGTKPYINVDVLCFIPREEEAYGYLFYDINLTTVENNYCIFVNYCEGREYPAKFMVEVWYDDYDGISVELDEDMNMISQTGDYPSASVLCFVLPPLVGSDTYFVRVTVLNDPLLDYNVDEANPPVREFEISQADIDAQLDLTPKYEHIRICD